MESAAGWRPSPNQSSRAPALPDLLEFVPRLTVLPPSQRWLWAELRQTPAEFVLYGGTALVLRLGHRQSDDFDFFSTASFDPAELRARVPYAGGAEILQQAANTLTCVVERDGPVRVSFFGGLRLRRTRDPEEAAGAGVKVASLLDLAATKAELVQRRACAKDYLDLDALVADGAMALEDILAAAGAVHGPSFNPATTLKALVYFGDGDLATVPDAVRQRLAAAVRAVDLDRIPEIRSRPGLFPGEDAR